MAGGASADGLLAVSADAIRLASGVSFLVAPEAANRLWGDDEDSGPDREPAAPLDGLPRRAHRRAAALVGAAGQPPHRGLVPRLGRRGRRPTCSAASPTTTA